MATRTLRSIAFIAFRIRSDLMMPASNKLSTSSLLDDPLHRQAILAVLAPDGASSREEVEKAFSRRRNNRAVATLACRIDGDSSRRGVVSISEAGISAGVS